MLSIPSISMKKFPEALHSVVFDSYFIDKLKRQPVPSSHLSFWHTSYIEAHNKLLYTPNPGLHFPTSFVS